MWRTNCREGRGESGGEEANQGWRGLKVEVGGGPQWRGREVDRLRGLWGGSGSTRLWFGWKGRGEVSPLSCEMGVYLERHGMG